MSETHCASACYRPLARTAPSRPWRSPARETSMQGKPAATSSVSWGVQGRVSRRVQMHVCALCVRTAGTRAPLAAAAAHTRPAPAVCLETPSAAPACQERSMSRPLRCQLGALTTGRCADVHGAPPCRRCCCQQGRVWTHLMGSRVTLALQDYVVACLHGWGGCKAGIPPGLAGAQQAVLLRRPAA